METLISGYRDLTKKMMGSDTKMTEDDVRRKLEELEPDLVSGEVFIKMFPTIYAVVHAELLLTEAEMARKETSTNAMDKLKPLFLGFEPDLFRDRTFLDDYFPD
jgi:hypothetical protein